MFIENYPEKLKVFYKTKLVLQNENPLKIKCGLEYFQKIPEYHLHRNYLHFTS